MAKASPPPEPGVVHTTAYGCPGCGLVFDTLEGYESHAREHCTQEDFAKAEGLVGGYVLLKDLDGCGRVVGTDGCLLNGVFVFTHSDGDRYEIMDLCRSPHVREVTPSTESEVRGMLEAFASMAVDRIVRSLERGTVVGGDGDE